MDQETLDGLDDPSAPPAQRMRRLTVVYPPTARSAVTLAPGRYVVGRDVRGPHAVRLDDGQVSREHAELVYRPAPDLWRLRDLGSRNGCHVDGRPVHDAVLSHGSVLRLGTTLLVFCDVPVPTAHPVPSVAEGASLVRAFAEQLADLSAPSDLPLLVTGPTGAGKELLARRVHQQSGRVGELVPLNCATLSAELHGSDLFGHVRGAFTGAHAPRTGLFAAAHGGTLFLDEIADLPAGQQAALLRVLQEKRLRPVGADREHPVDVRTICATNRDLTAMEASGAFRSDLLGRLATVRIELPGLTDRREEILPLLETYLGPGAPPLTLAAAETLLLYGWPRNVRDIQHVAAHIRLFASAAESIHVDLLPPNLRRGPAGTDTEPDAERPDRETMRALLRAHGGNVTGIARALNRHRGQVYRWLAMYGLDPADARVAIPTDD